MRLLRYALPAALLLLVFAVGSGFKIGDPPGSQMRVLADSFLETLGEKEAQVALLPYDSPKRVGWHFIPKESRKGLVLSEMNTAQRTAALRLLQAALSEAGYTKTSQVMLLEGVLLELEGPSSQGRRDPLKYYLTLFGKPSDSEPWGMSFEGHHLSLNFSCREGELVDNTPQFFGANPATIMTKVEGPLDKGTRVLRKEEDLAFDLVNQLDSGQLKKAVISEEALAEIRFAGEAQVNVGDPDGIPYSELQASQQDLLKQLVNVYINAVPEEVADERRAEIERNGWDGVHFAWAGAKEPGLGHYYRIRGKEFLIEFVNTQADPLGNPANHIHCVWRDLTGDFDLPAGQ